MEAAGKILEMLKSRDTAQFCSWEEYERRKVEEYNSMPGDLDGMDCPICLNRGNIAVIGMSGTMSIRLCKCMKTRQSLQRIERSGLKNLLGKYTFERYIDSEPWQKQAKAMAMAFIDDSEGNWFFAGGQVGCGKTHLCTAMVDELLKRGKEARYMLWREEIVLLKAMVTDADTYSRAMREYKNAEVLYVDDLFKTEQGKPPTQADVNIAFELFNYRYNNDSLVTIISSERLIDDLISIDEAVGSRIYERTRQYCLNFWPDHAKNYRMRL